MTDISWRRCEALDRVELDASMSHRLRLAGLLLDGMRNIRVRDGIVDRLRTWLPRRVYGTESVYKAMASWTPTTIGVERLWKGLFGEEADDRHAAARALASYATQDAALRQRLHDVAATSLHLGARAAALQAAVQRWPDADVLDAVIHDARRSDNADLCLAGIVSAIYRKQQTDDDQARLLRLGAAQGDHLDHERRKEIAAAVVRGWPRSAAIKQECVKALSSIERSYVDRSTALRVLLAGYSSDEDVVQYCVTQIEKERTPFALVDDAWQLLGTNPASDAIKTAIDGWLPGARYYAPRMVHAALVSRSSAAKQALLAALPDSFPHWPAWGLLEGWGLADDEVASRLREFVVDDWRASYIAYLLPRIILDRSECRSRLLHLASLPKPRRLDFIGVGLREVRNQPTDTEAVSALMAAAERCDNSIDVTGMHWQLISGFSDDDRVKQFARGAMREDANFLIAAAVGFKADAEVQEEICSLSYSLPPQLRSLIASRLLDGASDDETARSLLESYRLELDSSVQTQMAIGYYTRLQAAGSLSEEAVAALEKDVCAYGPAMENARQAAFCGLTLARQLDRMRDKKETVGDPDPVTVGLGDAYHENRLFIRFVVRNWETIEAVFGADTLKRLSGRRYDAGTVLDRLCIGAAEGQAAREAARRLIEEEAVLGPNILRFIAAIAPRSHRLLELCLRSVQSFQGYLGAGSELVIQAALFLGEHFSGKTDVLNEIYQPGSWTRVPEGVIVALCEGWRSSSELETIYQRLRTTKQELSAVALCHVVSTKSPAQRVKELLDEWTTSPARFSSYRSFDLVRLFARRVQHDDALLELLQTGLASSPTPAQKSSYPRLIAVARGLSDELRTWCVSEIRRQAGRPEAALNVSTGEVEAVSVSLASLVG